MAQKFVLKSSVGNDVDRTLFTHIHKFSRMTTLKRMQSKVLKSGDVIGRSSTPAMLQFMKSIQKSKLDPYSVLSNNLALESRKSMERLQTLIE